MHKQRHSFLWPSNIKELGLLHLLFLPCIRHHYNIHLSCSEFAAKGMIPYLSHPKQKHPWPVLKPFNQVPKNLSLFQHFAREWWGNRKALDMMQGATPKLFCNQEFTTRVHRSGPKISGSYIPIVSFRQEDNNKFTFLAMASLSNKKEAG